jgi:hypothetical protein
VFDLIVSNEIVFASCSVLTRRSLLYASHNNFIIVVSVHNKSRLGLLPMAVLVGNYCLFSFNCWSCITFYVMLRLGGLLALNCRVRASVHDIACLLCLASFYSKINLRV